LAQAAEVPSKTLTPEFAHQIRYHDSHRALVHQRPPSPSRSKQTRSKTPVDADWGQLGDPTHALYWGVRNDTSGIGLDFFDHSQAFGNHRLQGYYIDANTLELVRNQAALLDGNHFLTILSHELGHRWLAYRDYRDHQGAISSALRGIDDGHWSYLHDTDASYLYGADWLGNGDGSFTATQTTHKHDTRGSSGDTKEVTDAI
jgi:hypothetical protein